MAETGKNIKINLTITAEANEVLEEYQHGRNIKHKDTALSEFLVEHKACRPQGALEPSIVFRGDRPHE